MFQTIYRLILVAALVFGLPAAAAAQSTDLLPPPGADIDYTVKDRDTMIGLARRYLINGTRFEVQRAFWEHNQLKDKDQISPGQVIRIPENWVRNDAGNIELAHVEGDVQSKGQPLRPGAKIAAGDDFRTGKDGYVTIKLADGSTLALRPGSEMSIDEVRKSPLQNAPSAKFMLKSGRVEAAVERRTPAGARFEVRTPIAVAAVRGTKFRVAADSERNFALNEVLEGEVAVNDSGSLGTVAVREGYGTRVNEGQAPLPARALLPAPRLWTGIRLWIRRPIRLNFTRLPGASSYRVLVARRPDFADVISEVIIDTNTITLAELENGPYFLRVRGIDDLGLEGRETQGDLVLALDGPAPAIPSTGGAPAPAGSPGPAPSPVPPAAAPREPARQP